MIDRNHLYRQKRLEWFDLGFWGRPIIEEGPCVAGSIDRFLACAHGERCYIDFNRNRRKVETDIMSSTDQPFTMHAARTALNRNPELREWAEEWLKNKEREQVSAGSAMTEEEFKKHWLYVRPERMHEGAIAAVSAYQQTHGDLKS
ncbi:MAG: hypothetical protein H0T92_05025 [Pyrinomonadaceae bacterium]|jgi:hypothetical protein|nr:hypothetical protein [Pyrinomonadaceae bacterium]